MCAVGFPKEDMYGGGGQGGHVQGGCAPSRGKNKNRHTFWSDPYCGRLV